MNRLFRGELSGAVWGVFAWLSPIVISLLVTPHLVGGLGLTQYGLYSLVMGFVGFSFNLNISRGVTRFVAEFRNTEREWEIPRIVGSGCVLGAGLSAAVLAVTWTVSGAYADYAVGAGLADEARHGFLIGSGVIVMLILTQLFASVLHGFGKFRLFSFITATVAAGTMLSCMALAVSGYGLIPVLWATFTCAAAGALAMAIAAVRLAGIDILSGFKVESLSLILSHSKYVIGYQLLGNAVLIFERTVISKVFGTDALTIYVVPMMVGIQFNGFINSFSLFLFPLISTKRANEADAERVYLAVNKPVLAACTLMALAVWTSGEPFLRLWIGAEFATQASSIFVVQMLGFAFVGAGVVAFHTAEGFGKPGLNFAITLAVALCTLLVMSISLTGAAIENFALARAVGFSIWIPAILWIERHCFGRVDIRRWALIILHLVLSGSVFLLVETLLRPIAANGWLGLTLSVMLGTLSALLCLWGLGYFRELLDYIRSEKA